MDNTLEKLVYNEFVEPSVSARFIWSSPQLAYKQAPLEDEFLSSYLPLEGERFTDLILAHLLSDFDNILENNRVSKNPLYSYYSNYEFSDAFIKYNKDNACYYASISKGMLNKICDIAQSCNTSFISSLREELEGTENSILKDPRGSAYNAADALSHSLNSESCHYDLNYSDFILRESYLIVTNPNTKRLDSIEDTRMSFLLVADMINFVWLHEWYHAFLGHFEEGIGICSISETKMNVTEFSMDEEKLLSIRAFEFDADFHACNYLLESIYEGNDSAGRLINYQGTRENRISIMRLAHTLLTIYWAQSDKETNEDKRRHPTSLCRVYYINNIYNMFFFSRNGGELQAFRKHFGIKLSLLKRYIKELEILDIDSDERLPEKLSVEQDWVELSTMLRPEYVLAMDESDRYIDYMINLRSNNGG